MEMALQWSAKDTAMWLILVLLVIFISVYTLSLSDLDIFRLGYVLSSCSIR